MEYNFNGKKFTQKKNTFIREREAKKAAGITDRHETGLLKLVQEQKLLIDSIGKAQGEEREKLISAMELKNEELQKLSDEINWYLDFVKVKEVFMVILDGDVDSLTDEDVGRAVII